MAVDYVEQRRELLKNLRRVRGELENNEWDMTDPKQIEMMFRVLCAALIQSLETASGIADHPAKAKG